MKQSTILSYRLVPVGLGARGILIHRSHPSCCQLLEPHHSSLKYKLQNDFGNEVIDASITSGIRLLRNRHWRCTNEKRPC